MYSYICVFLIYPTFVGSECNKVIVIVIDNYCAIDLANFQISL